MSTAISSPSSETRANRVELGTSAFAAVLGVFIVLCFPQVLAGLKTFVYRDFGLYGYPLAYHVRESFWAGELPLWNPYSNCGLPFLAQWNTMVLYPLSLIYVILPLPWSLNLFCLLHLFLAGLGMYALARNWTGSNLGAAIAGTAYAFSGLSLCALMWPAIVAALAWMPWVMLTATKASRDGARSVVIAVLVGTMQMLTGAPEVILLTWIFAGAFCALEVARSERRGEVIGRFALVVVLVAGLSAAQLLPFLELLSQSDRAPGYDTRWSMPAWGWANLVVPLFRMVELSSGVYFQADQGWASSYYAGIGALALAIAAAIWVRDWRVRVLAALALLSVILAMGDTGLLYPVARKLMPFLGSMRYPVKFVIGAVFAIPLLAAFAVARREATISERSRLGLLVAGVLVCIAGIVCVAHWRPVEDVEASTTLWSGVTRALFLAAIVAGVWWYGKVPAAKRSAVAFGIVALVWLDGYTHVPSQNPVVDIAVFSPELRKAEPITPQPKLGESRAMLSLAMLEAFATNRPASQADNIILMRLWQYENLNLLERIPKVDGFFPLYLPHERVMHFRMYGADGLPRRGLGDFLGVSQVVGQLEDSTYAWSFREGGLPLTTLNASPIFLDAASTLTNLMLPTFDPRQTVFLSPEARTAIRATNGIVGQILRRSVSANRITVEVESRAPNLLVLAQMDYPAWSAYIDGEKTTIYRANYGFQAVEVPSGRHICEIRYTDKRFRAGVGLAFLSGCGCIGLWLKARRRADDVPR